MNIDDKIAQFYDSDLIHYYESDNTDFMIAICYLRNKGIAHNVKLSIDNVHTNDIKPLHSQAVY